MMRVFREPEEPEFGKDALTFALGAVGGLAIGLLLSRRSAPQPVARLGGDLRQRARAAGERARTVARRLRPARLRRMAGEQVELTQLEDTVLDAFLADEVLSERGIDVGAISPGIIELSGSVWTEDDADRAVRVANAVPGVRTVVNRLDIEDQVRHLDETRRRLEDEGGNVTSLQHGVARVGGMGSPRVSRGQDPDRPDDSHDIQLNELKETDQDQWEQEDLAYRNPEHTARPEVQSPWRTNFREDELDNQDPHGKHASYTLDEQPQATNPTARVAHEIKAAEHLRLEQADVPVKPHSGRQARDQGESH